MLKIEIIKGHELTQGYNSRKGVKYNQTAFVHTGSVFPLRISVPVDNAIGYPVGTYRMSPDAFQVGPYGILEINKWNISLIPESQSLKQAS